MNFHGAFIKVHAVTLKASSAQLLVSDGFKHSYNGPIGCTLAGLLLWQALPTCLYKRQIAKAALQAGPARHSVRMDMLFVIMDRIQVYLSVVLSLSGKLVHLILLQLVGLGQGKGQDHHCMQPGQDHIVGLKALFP